jgi:5-aminopentanamidase
MAKVRVALCQTRSEVGTQSFDPRPTNWRKALHYIRHAASRGADLAVFGEMHLVGYRTDEHLFRYAIELDARDDYLRRMISTARRYRILILMGAACYAAGPLHDLHNSALLIGPRGIMGVYHKTHVAALVYDGGRKLSKERVFFSPGIDLPVFDTPFGKIGVQICYDVFFPETTRVLALKGAQLCVNLAAAAASFENFWDHVVPVRAAENALWFAVSSVVGEQREDKFFGGSRIAGPDGTIRCKAKVGTEDCVFLDLDLAEVLATRACSHLYNTRNPKLYAALTNT